MNFKQGDRLRCVNFDGSTGHSLKKEIEKAGEIFTVTSAYTNSSGKDMVRLQIDGSIPLSAFSNRFELIENEAMPEPDMALEEILAGQELYEKLEGR